MCYHVSTIVVSIMLTGFLKIKNKFGVEETLQCGIMHAKSFRNEYVLMLPLLLLPVQLYLLYNIIKKTPFLLKAQLKFFVTKYLVYLIFLMGIQLLELVIIILGSINDGYYDYDTVDGYKYIRYAYLLGE
jgi:hypothetical protein